MFSFKIVSFKDYCNINSLSGCLVLTESNNLCYLPSLLNILAKIQITHGKSSTPQ